MRLSYVYSVSNGTSDIGPILVLSDVPVQPVPNWYQVCNSGTNPLYCFFYQSYSKIINDSSKFVLEGL